MTKHSKQDLVKSKRYSEHRDILEIILEDGKTYTIKQVDSMIKNFLQKEVK